MRLIEIQTSISGPLALVWPANQSRNTRELILPDQRTIILSPEVCRASNTSAEAHPFLLVIVCSSVPNFEARYSIRESWAQEAEALKKVKVVFMVGTEVNETHQEQIISESEQYGDIIQVKGVMRKHFCNSIFVGVIHWYLRKPDSKVFVPAEMVQFSLW